MVLATRCSRPNVRTQWSRPCAPASQRSSVEVDNLKCRTQTRLNAEQVDCCWKLCAPARHAASRHHHRSRTPSVGSFGCRPRLRRLRLWRRVRSLRRLGSLPQPRAPQPLAHHLNLRKTRSIRHRRYEEHTDIGSSAVFVQETLSSPLGPLSSTASAARPGKPCRPPPGGTAPALC